MADDVNVANIDMLKVYSGKLGELKDWSLGGTILICRQVEKIKEDLDKQLRETERLITVTEEHSRYLIDMYKTVIDDVGEEARYAMGNSDLDVKRIIGDMKVRADEIRDKISRLQMLLDNSFQHTKNYYLQISNMVDSCRNKLGQQVEALEEYKKQHM